MARQSVAPTPVPEPLLDVAAVMAWLGVSDAFVRRHKARLGGRKVGGLLKFERADVQAYLDRGRVADAAPSPLPLAPEHERRRPVLEHVGPLNPMDGKPW
jgi:hypothetical protein